MGFQEDTAIYQTATMGSLLSGVYDGDVSVAELLQHGDFGLGTFNGLDGEMLLLDGQCYQLRADGAASTVDDQQLVPFAAVTRFAPQHTLAVHHPCDSEQLTELIDNEIGSVNLMVAVKVTGDYAAIHTRTVQRQQQPYPPFTEVARNEAEEDFTDCSGTLAGFRMPGWIQGISVAGYHLHFLDATRRHGGHVLDYRLLSGTIELEVCSALHLSLPHTAQFEKADLSHDDLDGQIRQTEGS